jgi:glycogen debranching enzyme
LLEIAVGPPQLVVNQGHAMLVSDADGQIPWPSNKGLYFLDTRLISSWRIFANGVSWDLLNSGNLSHFAARVFLINQAIPTETGLIPPGTIGLELSRYIGGGVHEDLDIVNRSMKPVEFNLEIAIRSDFADLFEVKSGNIVRRGRITSEWSESPAELRTVYTNRDFCREIAIVVHDSRSPAVYANGRISFEVGLAPGETWHACLLYEFGDGRLRLEAPRGCFGEADRSQVGRRLSEWQGEVLKIRTGNEEFYRLFRQAVEDMAALRLPIDAPHKRQFVPAAGVPWFLALFGRDSLIASLENALVCPEFAQASLEVLANYQASERDDYRDADPGKIMHELRLGELAHFKLIPHTPYYGTADATILYPIVLHTAWRSIGERGLIERYLATAERCLEWIDRYGDRDGDGFQEYQTRSSQGYENQGWKDAPEAVVYPDGSPVKGPKALCELQGYVFDAWLRMAEIYDELGKSERSGELRAKAKDLFDRFNEAFWDDELGFYAFALDGEKKPVMSVASNPGHCLWSGIVPPDRAKRVVERLLAPDMLTGWGIRTLSADHPAYNPFSYQNGSVWPHDNAIIAVGFRRYGFAAEAALLARQISGAGSYFMQHQLPELYAGIQRTATNFPVQYLGANVPQAWAAGSVFLFLQAILGFQPDAPNQRLYLDPALPDWLPEITVLDLRLGPQKLDIRFWRQGERSLWEVVNGPGELVAAHSFAPCGRAPFYPSSTSSASRREHDRDGPADMPTGR